MSSLLDRYRDSNAVYALVPAWILACGVVLRSVSVVDGMLAAGVTVPAIWAVKNLPPDRLDSWSTRPKILLYFAVWSLVGVALVAVRGSNTGVSLGLFTSHIGIFGGAFIARTGNTGWDAVAASLQVNTGVALTAGALTLGVDVLNQPKLLVQSGEPTTAGALLAGVVFYWIRLYDRDSSCSSAPRCEVASRAERWRTS